MSLGIKKGQVSMTFNWVYVLIAGAIILLFFAGIVVKQKNVSEDQLAGDLVRIMNSIFTGAQVSEQTKNVIKTGGLADQELFFGCEEKVGEYGVVGFSSRIQNTFDPIFAPPKIRSSALILWSMAYRLPYKVNDFLFITSKQTQYFLVGSPASTSLNFYTEFYEGAADDEKDLSIRVNEELLFSIEGIPQVNKKIRVRVVDLDGNQIVDNADVPAGVSEHDDEDVTAVSFNNVDNEIIFYGMQNGRWRRLNSEVIKLISLSDERDAAKYGAIFSEDPENYKCNMQKAFKRLEFVSKVYGSKTEELRSIYLPGGSQEDALATCLSTVSENADSDKNLLQLINFRIIGAKSCAENYDDNCEELIDSASKIRGLNLLLDECPVQLY